MPTVNMKRNLSSFNAPLPPLSIKLPATKIDEEANSPDTASEGAPTPRYLNYLNKNNPTAPASTLSRRNIFMFLVLIGSILYLCISFSTYKGFTRPFAGHPKVITIVLNTFKRHDLLIDSLKHYSHCESVGYIYIVWSESSAPSDELKAQCVANDPVKIDFVVHKVDSLNNRFAPIVGPHTPAIFTVDDDIRVPCTELELGYEVWSNSPHAMVGFMPRLHLRGALGGFIYRCWWSVWWSGMYSIVLTKAAFLHHDYFRLYSHVMPQSIRDYVDKNMNCEDIAMQFLVSNTTHRPPIYLKGHLTDLGALNGISTSKNVLIAGHMDKRSQCLTDLAYLYRGMPLVTSNTFVDAAANGWTNVPSTWLEYISSDLWNFDIGASLPSLTAIETKYVQARSEEGTVKVT